jgi:hypothetical protein
MEAEGDPSVFNLSLRVLADNGKMMELVLDVANEKDTIAESEWTGSAGKYAITFVSDEFVTTQYVAKDAKITAPTAPTDKKWNMPENATATGNVTYYAVKA